LKRQLLGKLASTLMLLGGLFLIQMVPAHAQFLSVSNLTGLTATLVGPNTYTLSLASPSGFFTYQGTQYSIDGVSSFMIIDGTGNTTGDSTTASGWQVANQDHHASGFSTDGGQGGFGVTDNYLKPGQTLGNFTFNSSSTNFGFHVLLDPGETINGSNTVFISGSGPVPEPGFVQMAGLLTLSGLGTAFRKLKNRRSA
jgi:hypothetical protein